MRGLTFSFNEILRLSLSVENLFELIDNTFVGLLQVNSLGIRLHRDMFQDICDFYDFETLFKLYWKVSYVYIPKKLSIVYLDVVCMT